MADSSSGTALSLRELTKNFRGAAAPAVDRISLDIHAGEFMTFLGPSGSGKTTTLNMIAGLESVTEGRIMIGEHDVAALPPHRRDLGVVFQQYALFPHMTAAQNIAFPLRQRGLPKSEIAQMVTRTLDLVRLGEYGGRLPRQLSGGQQQRVALARAIVFGPRALLMDEPLGALDKKLREQLQIEIARLHRELGVTVVFVTHDQEEALALSDRIAVFNDGRIEQVGPAAELYERPATLFVATFLGDSNVLRGVVKDGDLVADDFRVRAPEGHAIADGEQAALVIRPERLSITQGSGDGNTLAAQVTDVVYQGAFRKVLLRFRDGSTGCVREGSGAQSDAVPGDPVEVRWNPGSAVLVPTSRGDDDR